MVVSNVNYNGSPQFTTVGPDQLPLGVLCEKGKIYVSLRLRVQNAVSAQPCVEKFGISLVLLNFLHCNFRLWFETP